MRVADLMAVMEEIAPAALQESWDNSGLLVGSESGILTGILLCVDVTQKEIDRALELGVNCIVSHHPLLFSGTKNVLESEYEGALITRLIREGIVLFAAHTNLDVVRGGVEDCFAAQVGLNVEAVGTGVRVGRVAEKTAGDLLQTLRQRIGSQIMFYGDTAAPVCRAATACGAGGDFIREAAELGADVFITGEIKHHQRLEAQGLGMQVMICGHAESESCVLPMLREKLEQALQLPVYSRQEC